MLGQLLGSQGLAVFQVVDLRLVGADDRRACGAQDAIQQRVDLALDVPDLALGGLDRVMGFGAARLPSEA
ncbi:MAG: hypothetical protein AAF293_05240 [Pseudomonadota bacterium]